MDPGAGLCLGCGRTLEEIALWGTMSEAAQAAVLATILHDRQGVLSDGRRQAFIEGLAAGRAAAPG